MSIYEIKICIPDGDEPFSSCFWILIPNPNDISYACAAYCFYAAHSRMIWPAGEQIDLVY